MVAALTLPDNTTQNGAAYKSNIDGAISAGSRIDVAFLPQAQSTPNMTVRVLAGALFVNGALTEVAAQNTGTITAPVTNPRIDRVVIDAATGAVSVVTGAENASPVAPAIPSGKLPVARVALATSTTQITASLLIDERAPSGIGSASETLAGVVELATSAEVNAGADTSRAITPAGLAAFNPATVTLDAASDKVLIQDATDGKMKLVTVSSLAGGNYFGDGGDGALNTSGNVNLATSTGVDDTGVVIKNYTSITINSGHIVTSANRAKAMLLYCKGNVSIAGTLHMNSKGAAGSVAADVAISKLIADALFPNEKALTTFRSVQVGGSAGSGGTNPSGTGGTGGTVANGTGGGAGGGGAGGTSTGGGAGAAGTAICGGSGGGGAAASATALGGGAGASNGGAGGAGQNQTGNSGGGGGGGAGNGGGAGGTFNVVGTNGAPGGNGGGGLLIIVAAGTITITGTVSANGGSGGAGGNGGGANNGGGGGGAGGGRIILLSAGAYSNSGTVQANGGTGGAAGTGGANGGAGGAGGAGSITQSIVAA